MANDISRRHFLTSAAAVTAGAMMGGCRSAAVAPATATKTGPSVAPVAVPSTAAAPSRPVRKLNIGLVGIGSEGGSLLGIFKEIDRANIVGVCEVDSGALERAGTKVPGAKRFGDFREMMEWKELEGVVVATPDHGHAVVTAAALRAGKHVYCEKPLTHTVREARVIAGLAKETGLVTQMGIQIHAMDNYRRVVDLIRSGVIGKVSEVHIWNNRTNRAANPAEGPVPATLNWDLWLGPVSMRAYRPDYHPYNWRRWWAFGSGMLGDIGCHLMDVVFWALELEHPTRIETEGSPRSEEVSTEWIVAKYDFPARGERPAVKVSWYDPPKTPAGLAGWKLEAAQAGEGVMFLGTEGMLWTNYGEHRLLPAEKFKGFKPPATQIANSIGHHREWIEACLKEDPGAVGAPFSYGALLTETALLGVVAFRAGTALEWDAIGMRITNAPEAEKWLGTEYREGWRL